MTYDLRGQLLEREGTAPVGELDVAPITARIAHRRTVRRATQVVVSVAGCAFALGVGQIGWNALQAPVPPAGTEPSPPPAAVTTAPACGDRTPELAGATPGLAATVLPDFAGVTGADVPVGVVLLNRSSAPFTGPRRARGR